MRGGRLRWTLGAAMRLLRLGWGCARARGGAKAQIPPKASSLPAAAGLRRRALFRAPLRRTRRRANGRSHSAVVPGRDPGCAGKRERGRDELSARKAPAVFGTVWPTLFAELLATLFCRRCAKLLGTTLSPMAREFVSLRNVPVAGKFPLRFLWRRAAVCVYSLSQRIQDYGPGVFPSRARTSTDDGGTQRAFVHDQREASVGRAGLLRKRRLLLKRQGKEGRFGE